MGSPRQTTWNVKLTETVGDDREGVASALKTWAILLADHAHRVVVDELRQRQAATAWKVTP